MTTGLDLKKRFSEDPIIGFLRETEAGMPINNLYRQNGFGEASYYLWRSRFGGMSVPDAKRLKDLKAENTRLRRLLAQQVIETEVIKGALRESGDRTGAQAAGAEHGQRRAEREAGTRRCSHGRQCVSLRFQARPQPGTARADRCARASAQTLRRGDVPFEAAAESSCREIQACGAAIPGGWTAKCVVGSARRSPLASAGH